MRLISVCLLGIAALARGQEPPGWKLQYFYDQPDATLAISDLKFPSATHGMAVGAIVGKRGVKPMSAVTTDGGAHWSLVPLKEIGQSLFFLNDSLGWMITNKGMWQTEEFGKTWRKLKAPVGLEQVYFADPEHGWAVGNRKQVYETSNGGADWKPLEALAKLKSSQEHTIFAWIAFAGKDFGLIGGWSDPPRRDQPKMPDWLDPETASGRREWPRLSILLDTRDGGKNWTPSTMSLFGEITRAALSPEGWGLGLIEFSAAFDWPSEVFKLDLKTGAPKRVYRETDRKVTDLAIAGSSGPSYLGAVEHFGKLQQLPIPRKVIILRSEDNEHWTEMPVDYRATARRVMLSAAGPDQVWAATDTGMILKLVR